MHDKTWYARLVLLLCAALSISFAGRGEAARIETVEAHITAAGSLPKVVEARMAESVRVIGEQLLLGKDAEGEAAAEEATLIGEVFDKVLVGYTVSHVTVTPGVNAVVTVGLLPWADRVHSVKLHLEVEGMPPAVETLVKADATGLGKVFEDGLLGLPVAAADWTNGAVKHAVNDYLAENLPEFRADFDIAAGEEAEVHVVLYPRLPVVRTTDLSMRSDTMPNFALLSHREQMQRMVDTLVGVPVAFVARHKAAFETNFAEALNGESDFRALRMKTQVSLVPAECMEVMSRSDSARYRARLTGWLDIGRAAGEHHKREEDLLFRMHFGWMASAHDELFFHVNVHPQDVDWWTEVGYERHIGSRALISLRYDLDKKHMIFGAQYQLAPNWSLRYEYRTADETGEAALRFRVHDFLSLEYAADKDAGWLRLLGDF